MVDASAKYIGRAFEHGVTDCYSIIRDWFAQERGIALPDFQRDDEWWAKGGNLYVENFARAGFRQINSPPSAGDVVLMRILSLVPNHGAIYIGNNRILHHFYGRLSSREIYNDFYQRRTTHVLRHENSHSQR